MSYQPQQTYAQPPYAYEAQYEPPYDPASDPTRASRFRGSGHLVFAAFLALAATVLLTLTTFSSPFLPSIHFLHSEGRRFEAFGYCPTWDLTKPGECWGPVLGYEWQPWIPGGWHVKIMILYGLASMFGLLALLSLLPAFISHHSAAHMRSHGLLFRAFGIPAALLFILAFAFSTYLFGSALSDFKNSNVPDTGFGPAMWISLGGTIAAVLSILIGGPRNLESDFGATSAANVGTDSTVGSMRSRGRFKRAHPNMMYSL